MTAISDEPGSPSLTCNGAVATLCLNRPRHHNRLEPADIEALAGQFTAVARNTRLRALIITAKGRSFSAGYHIGALPQHPETEACATPTPFAQLVDQLEDLPIPTLCALNGSVYGGATDLALACDFRLGVRGMELRMPAARLGIQYYAGGLRRYVERLGLSNAKRLLLTAATLTGDELLRIGFLDELIKPAQLPSRAADLAQRLSVNAPTAVSVMKRALNNIARGHYDAGQIDAGHRASLVSNEAQEGLAAWRERREPDYPDRAD